MRLQGANCGKFRDRANMAPKNLSGDSQPVKDHPVPLCHLFKTIFAKIRKTRKKVKE
jgi:hypothetical protein